MCIRDSTDLLASGPEISIATKFASTASGVDDDYVGFVFGFSPGDWTNPGADFMILAWKDLTQTNNFTGNPQDNACPNATATRGLELIRVNGVVAGDELWQRSDCAGTSGTVTGVGTSLNFANTGYVTAGLPTVKVVYSETRIRVYVNEVLDIDVSGTFPTTCLLYTSPSPRDATLSRMPSSA